MYRIFWSLFCAVNYGVLLLQAILEHWPETFSGTVDEADQDFPRADSPGLSVSVLTVKVFVMFCD